MASVVTESRKQSSCFVQFLRTGSLLSGAQLVIRVYERTRSVIGEDSQSSLFGRPLERSCRWRGDAAGGVMPLEDEAGAGPRLARSQAQQLP